MIKKVYIRKHELGLVFKQGDLSAVLEPGSHRLFGLNLNVEIINKMQGRFDHPLLMVLVKDPLLQEHLIVCEPNDQQRLLVWKQGRLAWMFGPGLYAFFKEPAEIEVEIHHISDEVFTHDRLDAVLAHPGSRIYLTRVQVDAHERALLFRNGEYKNMLQSGRYIFWKQEDNMATQFVDKREQVLDVAGQEIMTADKVTLRLNLLVTYLVKDEIKAVMSVADFVQALYREAQLVLRAVVGTRPLDKLLADKHAIGAEVAEELRARAQDFGLSLEGVGVRDIILPGDMKVLLNRVTEAQKEAEANLIRRREETAAARSQANTAKLLADSPTLMKMKELEVLQEILKGAKTSFILSKGDLTSQLRDMVLAD